MVSLAGTSMGTIRNSERTRRRVLDAATLEFSERGFDGARLSEIARRARVSKQLIHHHFRSKEALFNAVHDIKFRPEVEWDEPLPENPSRLFAERFRMRARDLAYIRFLTWEAAGRRKNSIPGEEARRRRIAQYGAGLRLMQAEGKLPREMDYRMIQLAILSLATYPMAFQQITRLVTGRASTDPAFQRDWLAFLDKLGVRLFAVPPPRKGRTKSAQRA